jgi:predicted O-methyltransferase YrrM
MRALTHFGFWTLHLAAPETQTTALERSCLTRHAAGKTCLAEVGVWHGVTTCCLRSAMAPEATLFAIDPYPVGMLGFSAQQVIAKTEVSRIRNGSVEWIRKTGAQAASDLSHRIGQSFDFVFIDGVHTYEGLQSDWLGWSVLVRALGVIALHDSRSTKDRPIDDAGSVRFTREIVLRDSRFEVVETVDSLTVVRRTT